MILVVGGTGRLGTELVGRLLALGHEVRVLTRDPAHRPAIPAGVELVRGDLQNAADLDMAVRACRVVISAAHGFAGPGNPSPEAIDRDANRALMRAAKQAGVEHFILLSVHGAASDHPMSLHRAKFAAEQALRESGLAFTILRPTAFMETWLHIIGGELAKKGHALVFGPGKNPINFVSVRDVAALAIRALEDRALRGQVVEIGGPENLSFVALAEGLLEARGQPTRIKHIPLPALRVMSVLARPFSPAFARQAGAAVVMNTRDFSFDRGWSKSLATQPRTTLKDVLSGQIVAPPASN